MNKLQGILFFLLLLVSQVKGQSNFDYFYIEAEKCRLAEDYASAAELYQHCLDLRPDAPEAIYNLALIQFYLRQEDKGVLLLRQATELDPGNPWYLETLASVYLGRRDVESAIPVLEKMAKIQTNRSDVLSQLAGMYKNAGRTQEAIDALDRIELLEGKSAQISVEKYALYMDLEEKEKAFAELKSLCDEFPHDLNYRVLVGNQYQQTGEMEKAKQVYDEVKSLDPTNANLQLSLLSYYDDLGDKGSYTHLRDSLLYDSTSTTELRVALMRDFIDKAQKDSTQKEAMLSAFDHLLQQPQRDAQMLLLKAAYQNFAKDPEKDRMKTMQDILQVEPGNELALSQLLQYHAKYDDFLAMEDVCRMGVNYHPEELAYSYYLGLSLYQQERWTDAADAFLQGLRLRTEEARPQLVSDMFSILGDLYFQQKREKDAFAAYDSALVYVDDNVSCLNNYAYYLCLRGEQLDKAEEMSYRTIKAEPTNKTYLDTYAWILFVKKEFTEARIYIDRVINPNATDEDLMAEDSASPGVLEHAGDIYFNCGMPQEAIRYWQLAKDKGGTESGTLNKKLKQKKYLK